MSELRHMVHDSHQYYGHTNQKVHSFRLQCSPHYISRVGHIEQCDFTMSAFMSHLALSFLMFRIAFAYVDEPLNNDDLFKTLKLANFQR